MQLLLVFLCCALVFKLNGRPRLRERESRGREDCWGFLPLQFAFKKEKKEEEEEEYNAAP